MDVPTQRELLTVPEFARATGCSVATIWRYLRRGALPRYQPGGANCRVLIPSDALRSVSPSVSPPLLTQASCASRHHGQGVATLVVADAHATQTAAHGDAAGDDDGDDAPDATQRRKRREPSWRRRAK